MEKSSEKIIGSNKTSPNPFNNLLSEVQIKINQPKSSKKLDNYALQIDPNIDKSNSNFNSQQQAPSKKENNLEIFSKFAHQNNFPINIPLKTKNSSDTPNRQKSQKDIIDQWIVGYMAKRHILGLHWEQNLIEKKRQLLYISFQKIKQRYKQDINNEKSLPEKIYRLNKSYQKLQNNNLRQFFTILKDDLLFGLSNTLGQERDHSLMLKTDSDYESLGVQSKNFKKQTQNKQKQQFSFSDHSQSNKNLTKKASQSVSASEDLSNLILNHNKLKIQEQLNKSVPNIPKSKTSQRSINTHKEICDLSIETKKQIVTQKKLNDDYKIQELPLQSNTNLIHTKKQVNEEKLIKPKQKQQQEKKPVTITFILNNLNNNSLIKHQNESNIHQQEPKIHHQQNNLQVPLSDQNIIHKLSFAESFYQQAPGTKKPIHFIQKIQPQKRSTSLQIKPGYVPLFPEAVEQNVSMKRIFANEYYPEQPSRQKTRFFKQNIHVIIQKVRPKSATPRITFTFNSNTAQNMENHANIVNNKPIKNRVVNPINNHYPYQHQDYIFQSILHPHNHQIVKPIITHQRIKHKPQVISPPRKVQSPKRHHPPNKMALDHRQHIRNNILPPASNEYGIQSSQRNLKSQKSGGMLMFMENQIIYDNFQKSTAQNSIFACSGRQSGHNYQARQEMHMKSPKDKIFVTYANPCNL